MMERNLDLKSSEPLFICSRGEVKPLTKAGTYAEVRRIGDRAGLNRNRRVFRTQAERGAACHYTFKGEDYKLKVFQNYVAAV